MDALRELRALLTRLGQRRRLPAVRGLGLGFATAPTAPTLVMQTSTLALVVQGAKRTGLGTRMFDYGAGHVLITSVRAPITTQIIRASKREPFLGVGLALDPATIASVLLKVPARGRGGAPHAVATSRASDPLLDAFLRYVRLLEAPDDIPVLGEAIEREIIWRAMQSPQGVALRERAIEGSTLARISRAIDLLQRRFVEPLAVADLAREARMSAATFHRHFRAVTTLSPIQFQKRLRLQAARMRLLARDADVATVSFAVGYQSTSQFSREYRRQFGLPPAEDAARWRTRAREV